MRVIFQDRCWAVHIPFVRIIELKYLAQLPVDHFAHPVVFILQFVSFFNCVPEIRAVNIYRITIDSSMLTIKGPTCRS